MAKKTIGLLAVLAAGLALALGGCGSDDESNPGGGTGGTTTSDEYNRY